MTAIPSPKPEPVMSEDSEPSIPAANDAGATNHADVDPSARLNAWIMGSSHHAGFDLPNDLPITALPIHASGLPGKDT